MSPELLNNISFVLVGTTHPGNIGAGARAMKAMGMSRLVLVKPKIYPSAEATARASGADDLLANAVVCDTLEEAIGQYQLVIGTSARRRRLSSPWLDARECGHRVVGEIRQGRVALVFGREHSGLTNKELEHCHKLVHIPTDPDFGSLNIAAAVQILAYEIRMALYQSCDTDGIKPGSRKTASSERLNVFYRHLEQTLIEIDFLDPENPRYLMRRLRHLFDRARPDDAELNILRGILTAIRRERENSGY